MARALETADLPSILACTLWPWIDGIEAALPGDGGTVQRAATDTLASLHRLLAMTAPLETMMEDAFRASSVMAGLLDRRSPEAPLARMEALLALGDLIAWLRGAKPSEHASRSGLGW